MPVQGGQAGSSQASKLQRTLRKRASVYSAPDTSLKLSATDSKVDPTSFSRHGAGSTPEGSLKREIRRREIQRRTSLDRSSPTREPMSASNYFAPGSTRQLAIFCEKERARFLSAKSAKLEEPLNWTAQPVPRPLLGLSVVFATAMSYLSRLWSALVLFCRKCTDPAKLDTAMISAGMMPSGDDPRTSPPLDDSGHCTPTRKYPVSLGEFFTPALRAGSHQTQSDRSRSKKDSHSAISSTSQYPRSHFEASGLVFTRAASAGSLPSSSNTDKWRELNEKLEENQRFPTIPPSRTSKKPMYSRPDHGVTFRRRSKLQGGPENTL